MLQDLAFGRLENEFRLEKPREGDIVVCVQGNSVLICRDRQDRLTMPTFAQVSAWSGDWDHWNEEKYQFVFRLQGINWFLFMGESGQPGDAAFAYESTRGLRQLESKDICFGIMTAWHLFSWYRANRFCGRCGTKTVHDTKERMMLCPHCGNMIFPKICPAVIIAVTDGDRLLLSKYAGRAFTRYALIAGYTEIGETLEQTVAREVMEEVGLKVKNLRYYKSQPWGVDGNILAGFFCDLDGDDTITLDESELSMAGWYPRNDLPAQDDGISLTREMVRIFGEGKEPR